MKKIIAISVMFAMLTVAAFADTSVGGQLVTHVDLLHSGDDGATAGGYEWGGNDTNVNVSWSGENAGGKLRIVPNGPETGDAPYFAFAWWKPIDQFRFQIGKNQDGDLGHGQIVGWGFTGEAKPAGVAIGYDGQTIGWPYGTAVDAHVGFWGGFTGPGVLLSIYPVEGFELDLCIPFDKDDKAAVVYSNTKINLQYTIADIGTARVAFDLNKENEDADLLPDVYFAFYLSAIENIGAEIGVGILSGEKSADIIDVGLGFKYSADDFGVKVGLGVNVKTGDADEKPLYVSLLPYYNLGSLTAFLQVGFGTVIGADESITDFFFNPYIKVPVNAGNFYAGIKFQQAGGKPKPDAVWSVPIGWQVYF